MNEAIFVFALVLCVGASVAAVLITWLCRSALMKFSADWNGLHVRLSADVKRIEEKVEKTSNAKLAAEVDALRGALDLQRANTRRELGSLWGRLGGKPRVPAFIDGDSGEVLGGDDEIAALLALQSAKPSSPGNGSV